MYVVRTVVASQAQRLSSLLNQRQATRTREIPAVIQVLPEIDPKNRTTAASALKFRCRCRPGLSTQRAPGFLTCFETNRYRSRSSLNNSRSVIAPRPRTCAARALLSRGRGQRTRRVPWSCVQDANVMGSVATRIARVSPFALHRTISFSRLPTRRQVSIVPTFMAAHFQLGMLFDSTVRIRTVGSNAACASPSRLRTVSRHPLHSARNIGVGTRGVAEIFAGRRNSSVPRCVIPAAWVRMIF